MYVLITIMTMISAIRTGIAITAFG